VDEDLEFAAEFMGRLVVRIFELSSSFFAHLLEKPAAMNSILRSDNCRPGV
jgi:hypothetical protein